MGRLEEKLSCVCVCFVKNGFVWCLFWGDVGVGTRNVYVDLERTEYVCRYVMYIVSINIHIYIVYIYTLSFITV